MSSNASLTPLSSESTPASVLQARLPRLSAEFLAKHYPKQASVVHVGVVHRHGERTPGCHRLPNISPENWNLCSRGASLHAAFAQAAGLPATLPSHAHVFPQGQRNLGAIFGASTLETPESKSQNAKGRCDWGQLTDVGRASMTKLGAHLRALYVDALGFLPENPQGKLYLRSSMYVRAIESLQHTLGGLYPDQEPGKQSFRINIRPVSHETMFPSLGYAAMSRLFEGVGALANRKNCEEYQKLDAELRAIPELKDYFASEVQVQKTPVAIEVLDVVGSMRIHGLAVPAIFDDALVKRLTSGGVIEWFHSSWSMPALARMQIGPFVRELVDEVVDAVESDRAGRPAQRQMSIYSGHDTTIGPLMAVLGSDPAKLTVPADLSWPQFASSLRFELLKDSESPYPTVRPAWEDERRIYADKAEMIPFDKRVRPTNVPDALYQWPKDGRRNPRATRDYYVRVWYNDRVLVLPTCKDPGAHHTQMGSGVCTLDGFFKQIARFVPSEREAASECRASVVTKN
ncbi:histidine phosphatase superfamily [Kickxella alabastrina]|uniref:histidine phosphatase superfamily n=1 Tax=Kickxella alabastrina TaxID=61397 RepID=UPI0022205556|nr:histidine phosphatase superfamily [Kickxella alabastrina]KAI7834280.1 histidine phosphatase superfamily [Kickxella alabastrina]